MNPEISKVFPSSYLKTIQLELRGYELISPLFG